MTSQCYLCTITGSSSIFVVQALGLFSL